VPIDTGPDPAAKGGGGGGGPPDLGGFDGEKLAPGGGGGGGGGLPLILFDTDYHTGKLSLQQSMDANQQPVERYTAKYPSADDGYDRAIYLVTDFRFAFSGGNSSEMRTTRCMAARSRAHKGAMEVQKGDAERET
jgi:hypothetical protein